MPLYRFCKARNGHLEMYVICLGQSERGAPIYGAVIEVEGVTFIYKQPYRLSIISWAISPHSENMNLSI